MPTPYSRAVRKLLATSPVACLSSRRPQPKGETMKRKHKSKPSLGEQILEARKSAGLTQAELGEKVGVTQTAIHGIECNGSFARGVEIVDKIRRLLGIV